MTESIPLFVASIVGAILSVATLRAIGNIDIDLKGANAIYVLGIFGSFISYLPIVFIALILGGFSSNWMYLLLSIGPIASWSFALFIVLRRREWDGPTK